MEKFADILNVYINSNNSNKENNRVQSDNDCTLLLNDLSHRSNLAMACRKYNNKIKRGRLKMVNLNKFIEELEDKIDGEVILIAHDTPDHIDIIKNMVEDEYPDIKQIDFDNETSSILSEHFDGFSLGDDILNPIIVHRDYSKDTVDRVVQLTFTETQWIIKDNELVEVSITRDGVKPR